MKVHTIHIVCPLVVSKVLSQMKTFIELYISENTIKYAYS